MKNFTFIIALILGTALARENKIIFKSSTKQNVGYRALWSEAPTYISADRTFKCAGMSLKLDGNLTLGRQEFQQGKCVIFPLYFDIQKQELVVQIALYFKNVNMARYVAKISGKAYDEYEGINNDFDENDSQMDTLGKLLNRMSRKDLIFKQERYVNGKLNVASTTSTITLDPKNTGIRFYTLHHRDELTVSLESMYKSIEVDERMPQRYTHINDLYEAVSGTVSILKESLNELELNSSDTAKTIFTEKLQDSENLNLIAKELNTLRELISTKPFHTMEIIHFLNEFSQLVNSIDLVLKSEVGTSPGFISTVNNL
jgi:hypothetical protein